MEVIDRQWWEDELDTPADELSTNLYLLGRKEASDYIDRVAPSLKSFCDTTSSLLSIFDWDETEQGWRFWAECYEELVSIGIEEALEEDFGNGNVELPSPDTSK